MKTRKHLIALLFVMVPLFAFSQSEQKASVSLNKFWDNWFISAGGGLQTFVGENYRTTLKDDITNMDYYTPAVTFSIGKMFTPVIGLRIQGTGWEVYNTARSKASNDDQKLQYIGGHGDVLINLNSLFAGNNPNRFFNITPFLGAGFYYTMGQDAEGVSPGYRRARNASINGGVNFGFRLSRAVDLNLEVQGAMLGDDFNNLVTGASYEGIAAATLGLTYKFNKRTFDACPSIDEGLIARLNGEINSLRSDLDACLRKPVPTCPKCPDCPTVAPAKPFEAPAAVGVVKFALGSSVITSDQQINVYNAADYLKNNSGINLKVVGYADKKTGNPSINMKLSEQRAKAVTKMLVNKYGIPENRIETSWDGDKVQPYSTNEWNRVVIFVPQK